MSLGGHTSVLRAPSYSSPGQGPRLGLTESKKNRRGLCHLLCHRAPWGWQGLHTGPSVSCRQPRPGVTPPGEGPVPPLSLPAWPCHSPYLGVSPGSWPGAADPQHDTPRAGVRRCPSPTHLQRGHRCSCLTATEGQAQTGGVTAALGFEKV